MSPNVSEYHFKFSVITAVYNVEPYLEEAIESILAQDIGFEKSVEMILVDDGSTDNSGAICDKYQKQFPDNIKVIHKQNGGAASARNAGIGLSEGAFISFMDADDKLTPNTLTDVYNFFRTCDPDVPFVSVPIYFFEKRDSGHRLNYKYENGDSRIIDLSCEYSFVQMSASSAFFRHEIIRERLFDTSLNYAEDAKLIMDILLDFPRYGIVPSGRYMYRTRNALDSALNVSKHRKEWYIDSLKYYTFWALDEAKRRLGCIPDFVQYTIMYDLLARFRIKKFPDDAMTAHEKEYFLSMLFRALHQIDDHIVMEQHNLSPELYDYLLSIKKAPDSGTLVYDADAEDQYFHYSNLDSRSSGSFPVNLETLDFMENELTIHGFFKIYTRFPAPSKVFLRLTSGHESQTIDCTLQEDSAKGACFNEHQLSVTENFTVSVPYKLLRKDTRVELCMLSGEHITKFHNLKRKSEFPVTKKKKIFRLGRKSYYLSLTPQELTVAPEPLIAYLKRQTKRCINVIRRHL